MSRNISTIFLAVASVLPLPLLSQAPDSSERADSAPLSELDALLAETEAFLEWNERSDPGELDLDADSFFVWSASLAIGPGHSSNFLKREKATGSRFLKLESDLFLSALLEKSSLIALLYIEAVQYDYDADVDNEAIVLLHTNWTRYTPFFDFGAELDTFLGDQIFDASLSSNASPVGERLRQARPSLAFFVEKELGNKDSLRLELGTERVLYEHSEDDYWKPRFTLEWDHLWFGQFETSTMAGFYEERYDEELSRDRQIMIMPSNDLLTIRGFSLEEEAVWQPSGWKALKLTVRAGAALEEDTAGEANDATRLWSSVISDLELPWLDLRMIGRWQTIRYKTRQVDYFDTRCQQQIFRSLRFEADKSLPWNLSIRMAVEWEAFDSRISDEQFSEKRVETLLTWSY